MSQLGLNCEVTQQLRRRIRSSSAILHNGVYSYCVTWIFCTSQERCLVSLTFCLNLVYRLPCFSRFAKAYWSLRCLLWICAFNLLIPRSFIAWCAKNCIRNVQFLLQRWKVLVKFSLRKVLFWLLLLTSNRIWWERSEGVHLLQSSMFRVISFPPSS